MRTTNLDRAKVHPAEAERRAGAGGQELLRTTHKKSGLFCYHCGVSLSDEDWRRGRCWDCEEAL